jgi:hypothetical protein
MKKSMYLMMLSILLIGASCKKSISYSDTGSWTMGNATYTSDNPSVVVNTSYGVTNNSLTFPLTSGAKLVLNFKGTYPTTYNLQSSSYYQDSQGNIYYGSSSTSTINITSYDMVNSVPVLSGTFNFTGYSNTSSVELTNGKFDKVTN